MWITLTILSAILVGCYDVTKKYALRRNGVMQVLFSVAVISCIILIPFWKTAPAEQIAAIFPKAIFVTLSWITGLAGMRTLPLTTAGTIKASRPIVVLVCSMLIFGERLNAMQWAGVGAAMAALWMLSRSSKSEGIDFRHSKGVALMCVSVLAGAASSLYDKHIIRISDPVVVLCWSNLFITALMGIVLGIQILWKKKEGTEPADRFRWDWTLPLTAVLLVSADALYFQAVAQEGALISIIVLIRRSSVVVTFLLSAIFFKENHLKGKALAMAMMLAGIVLLVFAS